MNAVYVKAMVYLKVIVIVTAISRKITVGYVMGAMSVWIPNPMFIQKINIYLEILL